MSQDQSNQSSSVFDRSTLYNAVKALRESGANKTPLYLYAPNENVKEEWVQMYPGIKIRVVPKEYLPTDTYWLLSQKDCKI